MFPRATLSVVIAVAAAIGGLFAMHEDGWPGQPNGCRDEMRPACFCERLRPEGTAQPANTWSNLGFVAAGLGIALTLDRRRAAGSGANPMTATFFYPALYAVVVALLGPGSMALHATMTTWGGRIDVMSMYFFIAFVAAYGLMRAFSLGRVAFAALYAGQLALLAWTKVALPINSDFVFGSMIALTLVADWILARRRPDLRTDRRWLLAAALLFGSAFAVWLPSRSGGVMCDPDSLLQGHAAWHLLCAGATLAVYGYLCSERPVGELVGRTRAR